jgi:hypothetical protein
MGALQPRPPPLRHRVRGALASLRQEAMIEKRDNAAKEMDKLAEIMNDPEPKRADVVAYIGQLTRKGQVTSDEATQILQGLPQSPAAIRDWARGMFATLMHVGIQAEAAYPRAAFPGATKGAPPPAQDADPAEDAAPEEDAGNE